MEKIKKKYGLLILLAILSVIAVWPFFHSGFFESHDGEWMIIRFSAFHQTLRAGNFPVRFTDRLNNEYGYPVLNFLYPLPFYLSEIPKIAGLGYINSIKTTFALSTMISALAMFWALSEIFSKEASFTGSVIYTFMPYRFVDLYVRGSIGENLAFAVAPLVLGSIFRLSRGKQIFFPILAFSTAFLVLAHNVLAVLFLPVFLIISMFLIKSRIVTVISFALGLLMSSFFWIPALYDLRFVRLSQISVSNINEHLVPVSRLIFPSWGYGPLPLGQGGFSPQIGLVSFAVIISAFYLTFKFKKADSTISLLLVLALLCSFLMTRSSALFWKVVPGISIIQFPWRLLSVLVLTVSILAAFVIDSNKKNTVLLSAIIVATSILSTIYYTKPSAFINYPDSYYATNESSTTVLDEYDPLWVKQKLYDRPLQKAEVQSGDAQISNLTVKPNNYKLSINAQNNSEIKINTIFFPGWKVLASGKPVAIDFSNPDGLITFKLPKGTYDVIIQYGNTPVHLASELVSLLALVITGVYFILLKWRKLAF